MRRQPRVCATCHTIYQPKSSTQRFCSKECKNRLHAPSRTASCRACGATFTREHGGKKYCSTACGRAFRHARNRAESQCSRPCAACGNDFVPVKHHRAYCSVECRAALRGMGAVTNNEAYFRRHQDVWLEASGSMVALKEAWDAQRS